jgi:hypothetical protein
MGPRQAARRGVSIADGIDGDPFISVRSFGASNTRSIIGGLTGIGFSSWAVASDGDSSSASADHGVAIDRDD